MTTRRDDIRFEERWRSGGMGWRSANGCLRVTVTSQLLVVRAHFPFSLVAARLGLDVEAPRDAVFVVPPKEDEEQPLLEFQAPPVCLRVEQPGRAPRTLRLWLREPERFIEALCAPRTPPSQGEYR